MAREHHRLLQVEELLWKVFRWGAWLDDINEATGMNARRSTQILHELIAHGKAHRLKVHGRIMYRPGPAPEGEAE